MSFRLFSRAPLMRRCPCSLGRRCSGKGIRFLCEGGEKAFITNYIYESKHFKNQAIWFTSLVSNKEHLKHLQNNLKKVDAKEIRVINMEQGNKISRILAWKY